MNYYNEIDPFAADWLRELIKVGAIADGIVDERNILDVAPADLDGYTQCHFFAGIGVWSYALRQAGWPDDEPVWTGSCPCQPFSTAGPKTGFADERHLWPAFYYLIDQCRPRVIFGEQVASKDGRAWIDHVQTDLENVGFAIGSVDMCAAGVGAPHIRQRLYFVGQRLVNTDSPGLQKRTCQPGMRSKALEPPPGQTAKCTSDADRLADTPGKRQRETRSTINGYPQRKSGSSALSWLADALCERRQPQCQSASGNETTAGESQSHHQSAGHGQDGGRMADAQHDGHDRSETNAAKSGGNRQEDRVSVRSDSGLCTTGQTNGFWRNPDWLYCRDGKWRPVESGTFPLASGATNRVGRLRGYGNAINAQVAIAFIQSYMEIG